MEELIKSISSKAGINDSQSKIALEFILSLLNDKLPGSLSNQLLPLLSGKDLDISSVIKELAAQQLGDTKDSAIDKLDDLSDKFKSLF